jgi:hypothetical protein
MICGANLTQAPCYLRFISSTLSKLSFGWCVLAHVESVQGLIAVCPWQMIVLAVISLLKFELDPLLHSYSLSLSHTFHTFHTFHSQGLRRSITTVYYHSFPLGLQVVPKHHGFLRGSRTQRTLGIRDLPHGLLLRRELAEVHRHDGKLDYEDHTEQGPSSISNHSFLATDVVV